MRTPEERARDLSECLFRCAASDSELWEMARRFREAASEARALALEEAAREADLMAAEYIGMAGEAEFDPNWIAGESVQGAAARIRDLIGRPEADALKAPSEVVEEPSRSREKQNG